MSRLKHHFSIFLIGLFLLLKLVTWTTIRHQPSEICNLISVLNLYSLIKINTQDFIKNDDSFLSVKLNSKAPIFFLICDLKRYIYSRPPPMFRGFYY